MGEAAVLDRAGVPCFTLASKELDRVSTDGSLSVTALYVSDVSGSAAKEVWAFASYPPSTTPRLRAGECIQYGLAPPGVTGNPPQQLVPGRLYKVSVHAPLRKADDSTRFFDQRFCIRQDAPTSAPVVLVVQWDRSASRWRDEVCGGPR